MNKLNVLNDYEEKIYQIAINNEKTFIEKVQAFADLMDERWNDTEVESEVGFVCYDYFIRNPFVDTDSYTPIDPIERYGIYNFIGYCFDVRSKMDEVIRKKKKDLKVNKYEPSNANS